jgi:hypothetical protein
MSSDGQRRGADEIDQDLDILVLFCRGSSLVDLGLCCRADSFLYRCYAYSSCGLLIGSGNDWVLLHFRQFDAHHPFWPCIGSGTKYQ